MASPTFLNDPAERVVIDTSAAININGTGHAIEILEALPFKLLAPYTLSAELEEGRRRGRSDADFAEALVTKGLLEIVTLPDKAIEHFESLVIGPAALTLDDGEAATIAYAAARGAVAVIDERKARRICASRFSNLRVVSTVDLLAHPAVQGSLGAARLGEALFNALQRARMNVPPQHEEWIVRLIGKERAALCLSLPKRARVRAA